MPWIKKVKPPVIPEAHDCELPAKWSRLAQFLGDVRDIEPKKRFYYGSVWQCPKCKKLWEYALVESQLGGKIPGWNERFDLRVTSQGDLYVDQSERPEVDKVFPRLNGERKRWRITSMWGR